MRCKMMLMKKSGQVSVFQVVLRKERLMQARCIYVRSG